MSAQVPNNPTVPNNVVSEYLPPTTQPIEPFHDRYSYVNVNHDYKLVQWRHLPAGVKHRFYEETVFRHQPAAQYNSITRTRKYGLDKTNLASKYRSNHLSGNFAPDNLERLKGKQIQHDIQK
jgi:hypothetical protein